MKAYSVLLNSRRSYGMKVGYNTLYLTGEVLLTEAEAKPYSVYIGAGGLERCRHLRCQIWGHDYELLASFEQESRILNPNFFCFRSLEGCLRTVLLVDMYYS